jgi:hypothetical protein
MRPVKDPIEIIIMIRPNVKTHVSIGQSRDLYAKRRRSHLVNGAVWPVETSLLIMVNISP